MTLSRSRETEPFNAFYDTWGRYPQEEAVNGFYFLL